MLFDLRGCSGSKKSEKGALKYFVSCCLHRIKQVSVKANAKKNKEFMWSCCPCSYSDSYVYNIYLHCIRFFLFDVMNLLKLRKISGAGSILKATLIIRQKKPLLRPAKPRILIL